MALENISPLERATMAMRDDEPQTDWVELTGSIRRAVRSSVRRGPDVPAEAGPGEADSNVSVADRVLRLVLRDAVNSPTRSLAGARVQVNDGHLSRLALDLACVYGTNLQQEAREVRELASEVLLATIGTSEVPIDVQVVDIDPL